MSRSMNVALAALALALSGCETTNSDDWTGGEGTPFATAERTCFTLVEDVEQGEKHREFFVGCMASLGWAPKPGASIDL